MLSPLVAENLSALPGIRHGFFTRQGGVSQGIYASLNCGLGSGDDPALIAALRAPVFYIGALGSKKTHAGRLKRLAAAGFGEADFARIHGPAGLDIGAKSPAEIAVSVLAQLTAARRNRPTGR